MEDCIINPDAIGQSRDVPLYPHTVRHESTPMRLATRIQGHGHFDGVHVWVVEKCHVRWIQRP